MATSASTTTQGLAEQELNAWRGLLRTHAMLVKRLDAELEAEHGLPLTSYEVLLNLWNAEGGKMRMCDVAESVLLSRSGLTRLVDRLERDGLVERAACADDARGSFAKLTDLGREKLAEARGTHLAGVREHFLAHLSQQHLEVLADAWTRVGTPGAGGGACGAE
jgi:DNA-binding MarR family transcriptional regulator